MSDLVKNFINSLTPKNFFLTKSMEFTKERTSGTLWYLKKFLIIYDAIFLSRSIRTKNGVKAIIDKFDKYIDSLPLAQKKKAKEFFYPSQIDIRSKNIKTYFDFAGTPPNQDDDASINAFYAMVDKFYFMYLMNLGGQGKVNAYIRNQLYTNKNFQMSEIRTVIEDYYNSINKTLDSKKMRGIISDYPAALRNERQILFYYGYVHSRTYGAKEKEFCSLTPIGDLAITANAKEFQLIWEHQKLKLVSQPVTIEFPSIKNNAFCDAKKFKLNYSPYLSLLKCLQKNKKIEGDFYIFVLSRTNNQNIEDVISHYDLFLKGLPKIKRRIESFRVQSDIKSEDFSKELKKYLLGIRSDIINDFRKNAFGVCRHGDGGWVVSDQRKLDWLIKIYSCVTKYRDKNYDYLFSECEEELVKKYIADNAGSKFQISPRVKISWDLYNIHANTVIMSALMIAEYVMSNECEMSAIKINDLMDYCRTNFSVLLKGLSINTKAQLKEKLQLILSGIINDNLEDVEIVTTHAVQPVVINRYTNLNTTDLLSKIEEVSLENISSTTEHKRDGQLRDLMKIYYMACFSEEDKLIKCDCCGGTTFLNQRDEPYLEFHHLIPFSIADGPDHYRNLYGICPSCHSKVHNIKDELKSELYDSFDTNNHFKVSILERLKELHKSKSLKSYQLEFALAEQMIDEKEYFEIVGAI